MKDALLVLGAIVAFLLVAVALGRFIFWMWLEPLYHSRPCACRRCGRDERMMARVRRVGQR